MPRALYKPYYLDGTNRRKERFWACQIWLSKSVTYLETERRSETSFPQSTLKQALSPLAQHCSWERDTVLWHRRRRKLVSQLNVETGFEESPPVWDRAELWLPALVTSSLVAGETRPGYMQLPILAPVFSLIRNTEPVTSDFLEQLLLPAGRPTGWRLKGKRVPACELCPADFRAKLESPETPWWKALQMKWRVSVPSTCLGLGSYVVV